MKKINESGRSMIEMLAVLVIFVILSLLGIVGFDFMKDRQHANEVMKVAINVYNIGRTKGHNTTTEYERMEVPKGILRMDVNVAKRIVTMYYDEKVITPGLINSIRNLYNYEVTETTVDNIVGGEKTTYNILLVQF